VNRVSKDDQILRTTDRRADDVMTGAEPGGGDADWLTVTTGIVADCRIA
jgi:hypothetical protein